jgi:hypothetical protein
MHLGELISRFDDEAVVVEMLARLDDLPLLVRVQETADASSMDLCSFAQTAVGRFASSADDAQWLGLIAVATKAADPGLAAFRRMLELALSPAAMYG